MPVSHYCQVWLLPLSLQFPVLCLQHLIPIISVPRIVSLICLSPKPQPSIFSFIVSLIFSVTISFLVSVVCFQYFTSFPSSVFQFYPYHYSLSLEFLSPPCASLVSYSFHKTTALTHLLSILSVVSTKFSWWMWDQGRNMSHCSMISWPFTSLLYLCILRLFFSLHSLHTWATVRKKTCCLCLSSFKLHHC